MKKLTIMLFIITAIAACRNGNSNAAKGGDTSTATKPVVDDEDISKTLTTVQGENAEANTITEAKGKQLIASADCNTCHKEQEKVIGPALTAIANKYTPTTANIDTLANKIIKGGSGKWGNVPMTPHPQLSVADAQGMVKYILSLKSK